MSDLGRLLLLAGLLLAVVGLLLILSGRLNLPLGPLPGDMSWKGRGWTVSFPLATSILLSVVITLILDHQPLPALKPAQPERISPQPEGISESLTPQRRGPPSAGLPC